MRIKELFESIRFAEALPTQRMKSMPWYHGGGDFSKFNLSNIGTGENNHILGRGIYFTNSEHFAKRYIKYAPIGTGHLYEVSLNITGDIYNSAVAKPPRLADKLNRIAVELGFSSNEELSYARGKSLMQHGKGSIGSIFYILGDKGAWDLLKKYGIQGSYDNLGGGFYELAIYDPSIIRIVNKSKI